MPSEDYMPDNEQQQHLTTAQQAVAVLLDKAGSTVITFAGPETPALGNWTIEALVDEAGRLGEMEKRAKAAKDTIKLVIKSKLEGKAEQRGDTYELKVGVQNRTALKQDKAKAKLLKLGGQAALDECMETTSVETMRFKEL